MGCGRLTGAWACSVEESGAESLAAFVRRSTDLQTFNLNMNDIGTQGISKVSQSFSDVPGTPICMQLCPALSCAEVLNTDQNSHGPLHADAPDWASEVS